jgi:F-type H+-transporting ATPase subunit gamma
MANLIDIRRRIRSVKNTQQITKAMKMVAAARLRRAQDRIFAARPYALEIKKVMRNLAAHAGDAKHPLLEVRPENRVLLVVVTGDKGLAGSFNANVLRRATEVLPKLASPELLLLGRKGVDFFRRRAMKVRKGYSTLFSNVTYAQAEEIAADLRAAYSSGEYDAVKVVYNQFKSIMQQELTEETLLPLAEARATDAEVGATSGQTGQTREYLFEPKAEEILAELLPRYLTFQVYRVLLESQAAEHAARMTASDSATKNAGEIIDRLTLRYNRARQAAITTQLIEVVSGANALEG